MFDHTFCDLICNRLTFQLEINTDTKSELLVKKNDLLAVSAVVCITAKRGCEVKKRELILKKT
jgi:hypothetical protein